MPTLTATTSTSSGAAFVAFSAQTARVAILFNPTGAVIEYRLGTGTAAPLAPLQQQRLDLASSTAEVSVRRADQSTRALTVSLEYSATLDDRLEPLNSAELLAKVQALQDAHATDPAAHGGVIGRAVSVALVGDSLTENCQPSASSIPSYWFHALNQRLGLPFRLEWKSDTEPTFAKSGYTTTQLIDLGYASDAAASAAEIVFEMSGTNDLATSTPAEIAARRVQMWDLWLAAKKTVVALPITPRVNLNAEASEVNRLLAIAASSRPRVVFCWEIFALLLDAAGAVLETTYSSGDGTHFNDLGCSVIATALATRLALFGNRRSRPAGLSMCANRFMTGDNSGLATGLSVSANGTGTCTPSKVAMTEMGVSRFWQRFTVALTGQRVYTSEAIATVPGKKYRLSALMRVPSITAAAQVGISLRFWAGATSMGGVSADLNNYTTSAVRVETDEMVCPEGATVAVVWFVLNGTATADFSDICVQAE